MTQTENHFPWGRKAATPQELGLQVQLRRCWKPQALAFSPEPTPRSGTGPSLTSHLPKTSASPHFQETQPGRQCTQGPLGVPVRTSQMSRELRGKDSPRNEPGSPRTTSRLPAPSLGLYSLPAALGSQGRGRANQQGPSWDRRGDKSFHLQSREPCFPTQAPGVTTWQTDRAGRRSQAAPQRPNRCAPSARASPTHGPLSPRTETVRGRGQGQWRVQSLGFSKGFR